MALFKKGASADGVETSTGSKKKKKASGLSRILRESVLETALDKFRANDAFIRYEGGERKYVGLVLDTRQESIGGLDGKRNEAKGSIVECINSGKIQTYLTPELLDMEYVCIIPDAGTLLMMDEFTLLSDDKTKYELCEVNDVGDIELLGKNVTLNEVSMLVVNDGHIDDILGRTEEMPEDIDELLEGMDDEMLPPDSEPADDGGLEDDEYLDEFPDEGNDDLVDLGADDFPDVDDSFPADVDAAYDAAMQDAPVDQVVPDDIVAQTVVRRFYAEDLGLEVTPEPFDAQFMQGETFVPFPEDREDGWLNNQLNEMSRASNTELRRLSASHLHQLRVMYFQLVAAQCERIRGDLDIHDGETPYGQMYRQIEADYERSMNTLPGRVEKKKRELEKLWQDRLKSHMMNSAAQARQEYEERYGKQHERELLEAEASERAFLEDTKQDALYDMHGRRKQEAKVLLDLAITEVLSQLSDRYMVYLADEQELRRQKEDEMRQFLDDNRQNDIARTNALAESLRQQDEAARVMKEQQARLETLRSEYDQRRTGLLEQIEDIKRENEDRLATQKAESDKEADKLRKELQTMKDEYDKLLGKFQDVRADEQKEFEHRFSEMRNINADLREQNAHLAETHRRSNLVNVFLLIVIAIAALAIGFIGGEYINTKNRTALEQQAIVSELQPENQAQDNGAASGVGNGN